MLMKIITKRSNFFKPIVLLLLSAFLFFTGCASRALVPTGDYKVISKNKVEERVVLHAERYPTPEAPNLEVSLKKYPVFKEVRNQKKTGQITEIPGLPFWLAMTAGGVFLTIKGLKMHSDGRASGAGYDTTSAGLTAGGGIFLAGAGLYLIVKSAKTKSVTKYVTEEVKVAGEDLAVPLRGTNILARAPAIGKEWELITDSDGRASLNIGEFAPLVGERDELVLQFKDSWNRRIYGKLTIPSSFFSDLKAYYTSIRPADLKIKLDFDDTASWAANGMIDGAENSKIIVKVKNNGEGRAVNVKLHIDKSHPEIQIASEVSIGSIEPGASLEKRIPLSAAMDIPDGQASFTIQAKESRGYDARPQQLNVGVRHLDKPALTFQSFRINDGTTGMARGNNNRVAESDETIEIAVFVRNSGVGRAMETKLKVSTLSPAVQIIQAGDDLKTIAPGEIKQGKIVIHIPRTFAENEIRLRFSARDMLGASIVEKEYRLPVKVRAPILAFENTVFTSDGVQANQVSNGADYLLEITPRNDGSINARNVRITVSASAGVRLRESSRTFAQIPAGALVGKVVFPFSLPRTFSAGEVNFTVEMRQNDFDPVRDTIPATFSIRRPQLVAQAQFLNVQGGATIEQGGYGELNLVLQNTGNLAAERVVARLKLDDSGIDLFEPEHEFGRVPAGATVPHKFKFYVKNSARPGRYSPILRITQADGFPSIEKNLTLQIEEVGAVVVTVTGKETADKRPVVPATVGSGLRPRVKVVPRGVSENMRAYEQQLKIAIRITDDKPILGLEPEVFVNGKIQTKETLLRGITATEREQSPNAKELNLVRVVHLQEGINDIEVRFMDSDNLSDLDRVRVEYGVSSAKIYALVVGVSEYASSDIERLRYAHRDAQKFMNFLRSPSGGSVPKENIRFLANQEATRSNVLRSLNEVLGRALENDVVYLYMAMHAMPARSGQPLFFMAYDSDPGDLWSTAIEQNQLRGILQNAIRSNKVIWIADACHAGTLGSQAIAMRSGRANMTNRLLREMAKGRSGLALFMAASANQTSQEGAKWGGGVFTHYLIKGLKGAADTNGNNFVSLAELAEYVQRAVVDATNGGQRPEVGGNYDKSLTVGMVRK